MKVALFAIVVAVLSLVVVGVSSSSPVTGTITVEATIETIRIGDFGDPGATVGDVRSELLLIWSDEPRKQPIGHAFVICQFLGKGGLLGSGVSDCRWAIFLPLGKIRAAGVRRSSRNYDLPLTGGTRRYRGAGGLLSLRASEVGRFQLTISIL